MRFATSSLSQAGGLRRSPSTLAQPRVPVERSPRRPPGGRGLPLGNGTPEGSSHCPHPGAGTSLDSGSRVRRSGVLVPKRCAPERRQDPAASPCVVPICRASGCERLRSPQPALCAHPASPTAWPPEAPSETWPSLRLRHARPNSRARAARAAAPTRAREAPARILPDIPRLRVASSILIHPPVRRGREEGETRIPVGSKPELPQSPGWRGRVWTGPCSPGTLD